MANIKDFAVGLVVTPPSPATTGTTLTLRAGEGATMPTPPFYVTTGPPAELTTVATSEKLLVTGVAGDVLTFTRAQSPTTAKSIAAGWIVANALYVDDVMSSSISLGQSFTGTVNGVNAIFTTATAVAALTVYKNGIRMKAGSGNDYVFTNNNTVTFEAGVIPATGTVLTYDAIIGNQLMISGSNSTVSDEVPTGVVNNSNTVFTTVRPYIAGSLEVYINGVKQKRGIHFTETSPTAGTLTMSDAPLTADDIMTNYQFVASVTGNADTVDGYHFGGIMDKVNPIGTIYSNKINATNPATLFDMPWSTWVALPGRMVIGVDPASPEFDAGGDTGGAKVHNHGSSQMTAGIEIFTAGGAQYLDWNGRTGTVFSQNNRTTAGSSSTTGHSETGPGGVGIFGNTDNGSSMPPYVAAYMWERTA